MNPNGFNPRVQRFCVWMAPVFVVGFMIGFYPIAGFFPPPPPSDSGAEIAKMYIEDKTAIRIGCFVMIISLAFLAPWGAAIAMWTRRMENDYPILAYGQVACVGLGTLVVMLIPMTWAAAAFRPDDIDPDITRAFNDYAWFLFLYSWPPFSVWFLLIAIAIITDRSERPIFPRWAAYFNVWAALLLVPGGMMASFKTGPLAYNGAIAFYIPLGIFFVWMGVMSVVMLQAVKNEEQRLNAAGALVPTPAA